MQKTALLIVLISVFFIVPEFTSAQKTASLAKPPVKLGVSTINVTPLTPVLMSGYGARKTPYTSIRDSLYASALFFTDGKNKALLITADLIGYPHDFINELKRAISARIIIPVDNIIITAVHNHGGPVTRTYETNVPESVNQYVAELKEKLIKLAVTASIKPVPFKLGVDKGTCNMNMNRRQKFEDGSVWLGKNPDGPCDHDVTVVKMEDMNNKLLAVFINWPCHATCSGEDNYLITADWPGSAARYIKKEAGNDVVVAITAGASGDIDPIYGPGTSFRHIYGTGYAVGLETLSVLNNIKTMPVYYLNTANSSITYAGKKRDKDHFPQESHEKADDIEIRLSGLRVGSMIFTGISGELMNEIGMQVKKLSPFSGTMVVTHCNGSSGYICTDKAFTEGGYEPMVSGLMPGIEKPLIDKFMELILEL